MASSDDERGGAAGVRQALKRRLFVGCDKDGDGHLSKFEMRSLASTIGFQGDDDAWSQEFDALCREFGVSPAVGIPERIVLELLDDESDNGCYCTDEEITQLLTIHLAKGRGGDGCGGGASFMPPAPPTPPARGRPAAPPHVVLARNGRRGSAPVPTPPARPRVKAQEPGRAWVFFTGAGHAAEAALLQRFEEAGIVQSLALSRTPDGRSRGWGRVCYSSAGEAEQALLLLHRSRIDGNELMLRRVDNAGRDNDHSRASPALLRGGDSGEYRTVSFGGASPNTTAEHLQRVFLKAGRLIKFWLFTHWDGRSKGKGIAQYQTEADAKGAIESLDGCIISDWSLSLQLDTSGAFEKLPHVPNDGLEQGFALSYGPAPRDRAPRTSPYQEACGEMVVDPLKAIMFSNVPLAVTEKYLRKRFETVGKVQGIKIFTGPDGRSRGTGMVEYTTEEAAERAYRELHGQDVSGSQMIVEEF